LGPNARATPQNIPWGIISLTRFERSVRINTLEIESEVDRPVSRNQLRSQVRGLAMCKCSLTALVAALVVSVLVQADEKEKSQPKVEPAQGSVVGNVICSKCALKATEKCQTALLLATTYAQWGIVAEDDNKFLTLSERLDKARKLSRDEKFASSQLANKLGEKQFVLLSGKAGEDLFPARCSGKLVRVSGDVTLKDGVATITSKTSTEVKNKNVTPGLTLAGKLVCSKCDFKIGECAAGLKAGDLQVLLDGDVAKALFKARCSRAPKVATGVLTKIDGNNVYLNVSKIADPKSRASDNKKTVARKVKKDP
jgi:hypothetical protein